MIQATRSTRGEVASISQQTFTLQSLFIPDTFSFKAARVYDETANQLIALPRHAESLKVAIGIEQVRSRHLACLSTRRTKP